MKMSTKVPDILRSWSRNIYILYQNCSNFTLFDQILIREFKIITRKINITLDYFTPRAYLHKSLKSLLCNR